MADKFREIEAYLKAKIKQAESMIEIEITAGRKDCKSTGLWEGKHFAYSDIYRILFSNEKINLKDDGQRG